MKRIVRLSIFNLILWLSFSVQANEYVGIAVASNFLATIKVVAKDFTQQTGIPVKISSGATGMLYAQISRGAPYDLFFSADSRRPKLLEKAGLIEPNSRFTYATGRLVVWSPNPKIISSDLAKLNLTNPKLHFVAIANPKIAPYGAAAKAVLIHYGLYQKLKSAHKLVMGENIGKTFQYAASGNAQLGLVAKSYLSNPNKPVPGSVYDILVTLYPTLKQQAVVLKGRNTESVEKFLAFFHSKQARKRIQAFGYGTER